MVQVLFLFYVSKSQIGRTNHFDEQNTGRLRSVTLLYGVKKVQNMVLNVRRII